MTLSHDPGCWCQVEFELDGYSIGQRPINPLILLVAVPWQIGFHVERCAVDHLVVVEPDEVATLLRLTLSEQLKQEAKEKLSKNQWSRFQPTLFDYRVGSQKAFQKAEADQSAAESRFAEVSMRVAAMR